jgi:YVTN family beta-propeller protein
MRDAVEIRLLGPLEVAADGRVLQLGGGRQRALLAMLALRPGEVVSSDALIDALWGETPPPTVHKALQNLVSRVRRAVDPLETGVIVTRQPGYLLSLPEDAIDVRRFERLSQQGRQALEVNPREAGAILREALALWRGEPLAEFAYEPFAQAEIGRLGELRLRTVEDRTDADLADGRDEEVVAELQSLVAAHPLRERLRAQLMLALYRSGRQADALAVYRDGRDVLDRELGLEPGAPLRQLEQAILTQDPALGRAKSPPPGRPRARRRAAAIVILAAAAGIAISATALAISRDGARAPVVVPDSLVEIDAESNEIVGVVPVGRDPGQVVVVGPYVFVASQADETLHRLDTRTGAVETSGAHASDGALVAAGEFLWASSVSRAEVVRIHAETMAASAHVPLASDLLHAFVAVGGGSLWVSQYPSGAVLRLSLRTLGVERRYDLGPYELPVEITYADGASWTAVGSELLRIDGVTGAARRVPVGPDSSDPAYGFSSLWSGSAQREAVWRTEAVTETTAAVVPAGQVTFGLEAGSGAVWVTNYCDGTVSRIDPRTNTAVATIATGHFPKWLAVGHGSIWVGVSGTELEFLECR